MTNDMEKLAKEISHLEASFLNKANARKLAETRCENRLYKRGSECVRDEVYNGLVNEVVQLNKTINELTQQINVAKYASGNFLFYTFVDESDFVFHISFRATFNALEDQLVVIDRELFNKNHALTTDLRCLDLRSRLVTGDRAPPNTQTERNIILTKMEEEIPPE